MFGGEAVMLKEERFGCGKEEAQTLETFLPRSLTESPEPMTNRFSLGVFSLSPPQNALRKANDKKSLAIDEMLKDVLTTIPAAPLDGIGATPRNNEVDKKFNLNDMHLPSKHKVRFEIPVSIIRSTRSRSLPTVPHRTQLTWTNVTAQTVNQQPKTTKR